MTVYQVIRDKKAITSSEIGGMKLLLIFYATLLAVQGGCPSGYTFSSDTSKCYKYYEVLADYFTAARQCTLDGGQLTSIANVFNNAFIAGLSSEHLGISHWIGFTKMLNASGWQWMDASSSSYTNWASGQPDTTNKCGAIQDGTAQWESHDCGAKLPFICIFDPNASFCSGLVTCPPPVTQLAPTCPPAKPCPLNCDEGWTYLNLTKSCYRTFFQKNYANAEQFCQGQGGHLTSIHSDEENQFVINLSKTGNSDQSDKYQVVIGLQRASAGSPFYWSDGTMYGGYNAWGKNEPGDDKNHNCVELFADTYSGTRGQWETHWCTWDCGTTWRAFVCKKPAN